MKYEKKSLIVDGIKFNRDQRTGYYLSSKRILDGKRYRLHVYIWVKSNGSVPRGMSVHHIDHDKENNDISNLTLMDSIKHMRYHSEEYTKNHINELRENMDKNARPKACEWHGSKEGKAWHSKHGKEIAKNRISKKIKCTVCGKEYDAKNHIISKYCSNVCAAQARRDAKTDFIKKTCIVCGKDFYSNKYDKTISCSRSCGVKYGKQRAKILKSKVC